MGCGSVQTLDQEEKNIKIQEKIEENQIIEIQEESQNKPIKNKNMMNEIKQNFIQIKNDESSISTKKLTRQPKALHLQDKFQKILIYQLKENTKRSKIMLQ